MNNRELLFTSSSQLTKKQRRRKKKIINLFSGLLIVFIEIILVAVFLGAVFKANIIPGKYLTIGICFIVLLTLYNFISQFSKAHVIGKFLAIFLCIVSLIGTFYVKGFNNMIGDITQGDKKTDTLSVIVLKNNSASAIEHAKDYSFGYNKNMDIKLTQTAISAINNKLGHNIEAKTYVSWDNLIKALYNKNCDAIILNEAYRVDICNLFPDFEEKTKVIYQNSTTTQIVTGEPGTDNQQPSINVEEDTFVVFLSGNDQPGKLISSGLSDVNIVAVVNPNNRQILLVSTPRDAYVDITNNDGVTGPDKLTHAGKFGIDGSISAVENIYGVDVDYYARINFTGIVSLVDALGGVTVNSEVAFSTHRDTSPVTYRFVVGPNKCDGQKALAFCRERHNVAGGDFQRGRNQMILIQSIADAAMSPTILYKYSAIMNSISEFFVTNMPQELISELIKDMLDDPTPWDIQMFNTVCTPQSEYKPSTFFGINMAVVDINLDSVEQARELIDRIENREKINVDEYLKANPLPPANAQ